MSSGNHGWLVLGLGAVGALAFAWSLQARRLWKTALAIVTGAAGVATTLYDRHHVLHGLSSIQISLVQAAQSFVRIGWGLNVAFVASIVTVFAALGLALTEGFIERRPSYRRY
jgi:uncharacterized membrane protein